MLARRVSCLCGSFCWHKVLVGVQRGCSCTYAGSCACFLPPQQGEWVLLLSVGGQVFAPLATERVALPEGFHGQQAQSFQCPI